MGRAAALLLAPETPFPMRGGGAIRTASLLHYLARNYAVDLIAFRQPGAPHPSEAMPPGLVERLSVIDLPPNRRGSAARALRNSIRLARRMPPLVDRFTGFEAQVRSAMDGRHYEVGVIEHSWCAAYHQAIAPACKATVLDLHNIESTLHARCAATEGRAASFAHRVFEQASRDFERRWLPRFSHLLTASNPDAEFVRNITPRGDVIVYANAIPLRPLPAETRRRVIIFSGNMEYHPNRAAVRFFHREIWPELRQEYADLVWRLAGKNPHAVEALARGDNRIEITGEIDDAIVELARAEIAIVPLLAGSGTRFKILEAWCAGTPVVSTSIGAEGLPVCDGEHLLIADGAAAFGRAVARLLACKDLGEKLAAAGRLLLEKEFTWEKAWQNLPF